MLSNEEKVEITIDEFMREYKSLKREQSSIKNAYLSGSNTRGVSQNTIVSSYSLNRINKKKRQEELKTVLKDTMKLTTKLKEQLKILEKNGICGPVNNAKPDVKDKY